MRAACLLFATAVVMASCSRETVPTAYPAPVKGIPDSPRLPLEAAGFERGEIIAFAAGLENVSVDYSLLADDMQLAVVFAYAPRDSTTDLRARFQEERKKSTESYPGARWKEETGVSFEKNGTSYEGRKATYEFEAMFRGKRQQLYAELIVWGAPDRWVVLRSTAPSWQRKKAAAKNAELVQAIDWTS